MSTTYRDITSSILRTGWHVIAEFPVRPEQDWVSYHYTTGLNLAATNHPELVIVGMSYDKGQKVLNNLAKMVWEGWRFQDGQYFDSDFGPMIFIEVDDPAGGPCPLKAWAAIFDEEVRALQVIYADRDGWYPWEEDYNGPPQPLLGHRVRVERSCETLVFPDDLEEVA